MKTCAIVGINWGDEGKGRMVDLVAEEYDIVVRYQGGNNAGHTIKNDYGTFALNLLPSGIFRREKMNILGNGTVVDIRHLCGEIERLHDAGVYISPENLMISSRAIIVMPYHVALDGLEEARPFLRPAAPQAGCGCIQWRPRPVRGWAAPPRSAAFPDPARGR